MKTDFWILLDLYPPSIEALWIGNLAMTWLTMYLSTENKIDNASLCVCVCVCVWLGACYVKQRCPKWANQCKVYTSVPLVFMASVHPPVPHPKFFTCNSKQKSYLHQTSCWYTWLLVLLLRENTLLIKETIFFFIRTQTVRVRYGMDIALWGNIAALKIYSNGTKKYITNNAMCILLKKKASWS